LSSLIHWTRLRGGPLRRGKPGPPAAGEGRRIFSRLFPRQLGPSRTGQPRNPGL